MVAVAQAWLLKPEVPEIPGLSPDFFLTNVRLPRPTELTNYVTKN